MFDDLTIQLRNEAVSDCEPESFEDYDFTNDLNNEIEETCDTKSIVSTTSSKSTKSKSSKSELLEEFEYIQVKPTVETFVEIKKRLNNGNETKIRCPCNNDILFQSNRCDEHRKTEIHKEYVKQCLPTEEKDKKKSSKKKQIEHVEVV